MKEDVSFRKRSVSKKRMVIEKKLSVCFLIGLLLVMPIVLAVDTEVKIKTAPFKEVQVAASKSNSASFQLLQRFSERSDTYGEASFVFNFTDSKYNLYIYIKENGEKIASERKNDLITGEPLMLEIAPEGYEFPENSAPEPEINETDINETENIPNVPLEDEEEKESLVKKTTGKIVGFFTNDEDSESNEVETKKGSKKFYSIIGVIVVAIGAILFVLKRRGLPRREVKVTKLSDKINEEANRQSILDVENKLKEIQDELEGMK